MSDQDERERERTEDRTEDQVERLLELIDRGPGIPRDGAARLKTALRPIWRATLEARRARRRRAVFAGVALAAAAAVVALFFVLPPDPIVPDPAVGVIERVTGSTATLGSPDHSSAAITPSSRGLEIAPLQRIETGPATRVAVRLANGGSLRLDHGTLVLLESAESLLLLQGAAYLDTGTAGARVRIRTPLGTARDVGTSFEVRLEARAMTVRVRDGIVAVDSGDRTDVRAGMQGVFRPGLKPALSPIAPDASSWDWTQTIAPAFTLDGRTAAEFLDWVGRETGRPIRYTSEQARVRAARSVLHGDLAEVPAATAVDLVLPSAGLTAERGEDGRLEVGLASTNEEGTP